MTAKKASPRRKTAEEKRRAARRAELRLKKKRAEEALRRKRSRAAKKGWKTREAKKVKVRGATRTVKKTTKSPSKKKQPSKKKPTPHVIASLEELERDINWKRDSIREVAKELREVYWQIPPELGGPKILAPEMARIHATNMTQEQRDRFLADPVFETFQDMAYEEDIEQIDDKDYSAFFYH